MMRRYYYVITAIIVIAITSIVGMRAYNDYLSVDERLGEDPKDS